MKANGSVYQWVKVAGIKDKHVLSWSILLLKPNPFSCSPYSSFLQMLAALLKPLGMCASYLNASVVAVSTN